MASLPLTPAGSIAELCFSNSGSAVFVAVMQDVKVWMLEGATVTTLPRRHEGMIASMVLNADGTCLATGSTKKTIKLWAVSNDYEVCNEGQGGASWS